MEDYIPFKNETDYREAFRYECNKNSELQSKLNEKEGEIEAQTAMLRELEKANEDLENRLQRALDRITRLDGAVDAYKFCLRCIAGDGK